MSKEVLYKMIDQLPEEQLGAAIRILQGLLKEAPAVQEEKNRDLDAFLGVLVSGVSNVLYDLAKAAERQNEPIAANRHMFAMKKIKDAWEEYHV